MPEHNRSSRSEESMHDHEEAHNDDNDAWKRDIVALDLAPVGIAQVAVDGSWIRVNHYLCQIVGYTQKEFLQLSLQDITHPDDLESDLASLRRLLAGEIDRYQMEKRYRRRDGTYFWIRLTVSLVRETMGDAIGAPLYFVSIIEDIDAWKQAELERHDHEQRLLRKAALIDLASDAIFVQDPTTNRINLWSSGAERLYGWSREEAIGLIASDLLDTTFPGGIDHTDIITTLIEQDHWEGDLQQTCKDGRKIVVASRWALQRDSYPPHEPIAVLEVNRDVTAERAGSVQLRQIAESVQRALLKSPPPDAFPGMTFHARYESTDDDALTGGDFFDVYRLDAHRVLLAVGDATGHGIDAVTYTAEVKFILRAFLHEDPNPITALARLNAFIAERVHRDPTLHGSSYVALTICILHTDTGELEGASGGMEPPFLLRANTQRVDPMIHCGGPLLGTTIDATYEGQRVLLAPGDTLVLSTDGIMEARRWNGGHREFFGYQRLQHLVRDTLAMGHSLEDVASTVVQQVQAHTGGILQDDVCLLLMRRREM